MKTQTIQNQIKNDKKVKIKLNGFFENRRYEEATYGFSNDFILMDL